jgi:hypothetical protein
VSLESLSWWDATIVTREPGPRDRYGTGTLVETKRTPARVHFVQNSAAEQTDPQEQVQTATFFLWPGAVLTARDWIVVDGKTWEVEGDPELFKHIGGVPHHIECRALRVTEGE